MGPGKKFWPGSGQVNFLWLGLGQVNFLWLGLGQAGSFVYDLGLNWENFPKKCQIFSLRVKKISSGRVKKYPGQRRVGLLLTAGQK